MRGGWRIALLIAAVAAAVILFAVLRARGEDDEGAGAPSATPTATATTETGGTTETTGETDTTPGSGTGTQTTKTTPTSTRPASRQPPFVQIRINARSATIGRPTVARGKNVLLLVTGPAGEEVHLHGYDRKVIIPPSGTAKLAFSANLPGRFEVELEKNGTQIGEITVK